MNLAISTLQQGVNSLYPCFEPDSGLLNDPVFGCPTQYSTPYYAWSNAVLAAHLSGGERSAYAAHARRGLQAALAHLLSPELPAYPSDFQRGSGAASGRNHRDFFWPPALKTWRLLGEIGALGEPLPENKHGYAQFSQAIARVDPLAAFAQRPPSNWAAVWLSGEWLRIQAGLSPFSLEQFDEWLGIYFQGHILLEQGFYQEPGHPNSYDLFTRFHFADILHHGYAGRWRPQMERLLEAGLRRSLAVQLSDGTLASAHRSAGQSWTDSAQVAFFTLAANFFVARPELAATAREAALRAYRSLLRWQRPGGIFSPVYNQLPPELRVGYERYTADGHYSSLALAFLASAIHNGFDPAQCPPLQPCAAQTWIENDPIWRAVLHNGQASLQVNAFPAPHYDAFGITDLTFGPERFLQFSSSVRFAETGQLFNPGLALREIPIQSGPLPPLTSLSALHSPLTLNPAGAQGEGQPNGQQSDAPALIEPLQQDEAPASLRLTARPRGAWYPYTLAVVLDPHGVQVREATPGLISYRTLLVPFLRDPGTGQVTKTSTAPGRLELSLGDEVIAVEWDGPAERVVVLGQGFENHRGLCALARIDLADPGDELRYTIRKIR
jgi:hypothetical protein